MTTSYNDMICMRVPENILRKRLLSFQSKIKAKNIDAVMLRTQSSYTYFTGIKWLRPALLVPNKGEPVAFISYGEVKGYSKRTWIKNIETFKEGGELIGKVTKNIRENNYKIIGMEFGIERDAYILFYEMFKRSNPQVKLVDVSSILGEMRLLKDDIELSHIRQAGKIVSKAMEKALDLVEIGISETEIAAEIYKILYSLGSEDPKVYVNVGPYPRIHSEPLRDNIIRNGVLVTVIIGGDYNGYYANMARTFPVGNVKNVVSQAIRCMEDVYETAKTLTRPGVKFIDVMKELDKIYSKHNLLEHRILGYVHGVGLQIEETPITTILPAHRFMKVRPRTVLAFVHAPIMLDGYGQVKIEDTFIVKEDGGLEEVTYV